MNSYKIILKSWHWHDYTIKANSESEAREQALTKFAAGAIGASRPGDDSPEVATCTILEVK